MASKPQDTGHDAPAITLDQALEQLKGALTPRLYSERLSVRAALGRTLAESVRSPADVPAHANSAMDGYALRSADLPADGAVELTCAGDAFAGHPFARRVEPGQCVRIMTGGVLPDGADMVVMQERVEIAGETIRIPAGGGAGQNVRPAGGDLVRGAEALPAGKRLLPADLGILASIGVAEVAVRRPLTVAFFSTGDELRLVGEPLGPGEIHDSNRYTLYGMLARLGMDTMDLGIVPDDREVLRRTLMQASARADVVLTSGGVSVGAADYVLELLEELGWVDFWRIAVKPGRPLAFGHVGDAVFFGLPGNPVSTMATFYQVVRPALLHMMGEEADSGLRLRAQLTEGLRKSRGRREFQRGALTSDGQGGHTVHALGQQGSSVLTSMSEGNCFIILPEDAGDAEAGDWVLVEPFAAFV